MRQLQICVISFFLLAAFSAHAQQRHMVAEGLLKDTDGKLVSGTFDVTFSLYSAKDSVKPVWAETQAKLDVKNGFFQARLGQTKILDAATFAGNKSLWLGIALKDQPEFPKTSLETDPFAFRAESAALADGLQCTGCVTQKQMAVPIPAADGPGGSALTALSADTASVAQGLSCTGCVKLEALAVDLSLAKNIKYDDNTTKLGATNVQGAIEKLKTLVGTGGGNLSPDALGKISNGLLKNVFNEKFSGAGGKIIPDNNPGGVLSEVQVPDAGIVQEITVSVDITNADISGLVVTLFDPTNKTYVLHDKTGAGAYLKATYPTPDAPKSGDLATWVGKNAKGAWRLVVSDWKDNGGGSDGKINTWSVNIKYLSSTKIVLKGDLIAEGKVLTDGGKSNCFVKDIGGGFSAIYCDGVAVSGYKKPESPLMKRIFAGGHRSCGILLDDTGWCWGAGNIGKLSDKYTKFALSNEKACGLKADGSVICWAGGSAPAGTYSDVACSEYACCAVASDNSMKCWGSNDNNQTNPPLGNYASVDGGYRHFCAVTTAGDVKCWGYNNYQQTTVPQTNDVYTQVSLGYYHSCALRASDGYARCWGKWHSSYDVSSNNGPFIKLAKGQDYYHCGLMHGGIFYCWGHSSLFWNQLNSNENTRRQAREDKGPYIDVQTSRSSHTCAIRRDLTAVCWGDSNSSGKLVLPKL